LYTWIEKKIEKLKLISTEMVIKRVKIGQLEHARFQLPKVIIST
jgi:hypothetical protein